MERNDERRDDELIDLGSVTEETKGSLGSGPDFVGQIQTMGLSDD